MNSIEDDYFTDERIADLVMNHNWEMFRSAGKFRLRQKDCHGMETVCFTATDETARKYLKEPSK